MKNITIKVLMIFISLSSILLTGCTRHAESNTWLVGDPVLLPGPEGSFDEIAVKDPSVVFYENMWHVFYTARDKNEYTTGYVSAKKQEDLQTAPRHELKTIRGKSRYGCAPQIFFFEPQNKWYLIFQNKDANYQPAFSTTTTISQPETWQNPIQLLQKDSPEKWIDFWVICDKKNVYLFYTQSQKDVIVRTTEIENFPTGWSAPEIALQGVHEAVHIYKVKDTQEYHMIYELKNETIRSFGIAVADDLNGPWHKVTDTYATGAQLKYTGQSKPWLEMISHGEVIRSDCNQLMEYQPDDCEWLIQGILKNDYQGSYAMLTWKLGIIKKAVR